jgi:hypothetical protein
MALESHVDTASRTPLRRGPSETSTLWVPLLSTGAVAAKLTQGKRIAGSHICGAARCDTASVEPSERPFQMTAEQVAAGEAHQQELRIVDAHAEMSQRRTSCCLRSCMRPIRWSGRGRSPTRATSGEKGAQNGSRPGRSRPARQQAPPARRRRRAAAREDAHRRQPQRRHPAARSRPAGARSSGSATTASARSARLSRLRPRQVPLARLAARRRTGNRSPLDRARASGRWPMQLSGAEPKGRKDGSH